MKAAIIGLGYVSLLLSLRFARSGMTVLELEVDFVKVDTLKIFYRAMGIDVSWAHDSCLPKVFETK